MNTCYGILKAMKVAKFLIVIVVIVVIGIGAGFFLTKLHSKSLNPETVSSKGMVKSATEVGTKDTKTFSDNATGTIEVGGLNGEGTHHLIRDGGPSKTAYLISSIVDLDQFVGKKVEVFGQTLKAQKAAWLMDVGRVKLLN